MGPFRGIYRWLTKPSYETPKPDDIVELATFPTFQQADELMQLLNNVGLVATTFGNSELNESYGSQNLGAINYGFGGYRVMVRGDGLAQAREVLADFKEELRKRAN